MITKTLSYFGLCRRAGKLALGHDAVADALRFSKAKLCVLTNDASARHETEITRIQPAMPILRLPCSSEELQFSIGKKVCVLAVLDEGFAKTICMQYDKEAIYGSKI